MCVELSLYMYVPAICLPVCVLKSQKLGKAKSFFHFWGVVVDVSKLFVGVHARVPAIDDM